MSTIRPLATIAVLAVVGAFLAWKINEGPTVALDDAWTPAPDAEAAPAWGAAEDAPATVGADDPPAWGQPSIESPTNGEPAGGLPPLEAIDEPPPTPTIEPVLPLNAGPPTATNQTLELPSDIPEATYSSDTPGALEPGPPAVSGGVPSLGTLTPDLSANGSALEAAWPAILAALERDELTRAHRMLSTLADEPSLSPARRQEVDTLLAELAGTVIYSMEHRLEPPHTVAAGETLGTIAQQYQTPWRLLAKINGIPTIDGVTPGQTIKVIRGPFDARVDLTRGELTLSLDNHYAGRFPIAADGPAPSAGAWSVESKQDEESLGAPGKRIVLSDSRGDRVEMGSAPTNLPGGRLSIAANDMSDVFDILSVGSKVTIIR